jgi:uncharacterized protein YfkK (UPF0435 family)
MKEWIYNQSFIESNIEEVFIQSTSSDLREARVWYKNAGIYAKDMSTEFGVPLVKCCALISVLSPQKEWWQNIQLTRSFLRSRGTHVRHIGRQVEKAKTIYNFCEDCSEIDDVINGRKTVNFFHNIHSPTQKEWITIDSHMIGVCTGRMEIKSVTNKQYDFLANILKNKAKKHNFVPSEFQALLWLTWKRIKPRYNELKN